MEKKCIPQQLCAVALASPAIRPGDVVWCPPGVKHWHGAASATAMTHLAVTGAVDGKNVNWMEKVSDEQYNVR